VSRGVLAECIVAKALGIPTDGVRDLWDPFDLKLRRQDVTVRVEVKSSAYLQGWRQKTLSKISFSTRKTFAFDRDSGTSAKTAGWQSDVYVFAHLLHEDKSTVNPLDLDQWTFYVLPTDVLVRRTRSQYAITLKTLRSPIKPSGVTARQVDFEHLPEAVAWAFEISDSGADATGMAWWKDHQGEGWDPERAKEPGPDGQPSDYNLFFEFLGSDIELANKQAGTEATLKFTTGDQVTGRVAGWDEAMANNALDEPDPSIPTLEGMAEMVTGTLDISHVHIPSQGIAYTRYSVDGVDVDPDSLHEQG
jgi:hypothetical protein